MNSVVLIGRLTRDPEVHGSTTRHREVFTCSRQTKIRQ